MPRRLKKEGRYLFSEMDREYRNEITGNLGRKVAEKTVWLFIPDFPVDHAAALAWDTSIVIADRDIELLADLIAIDGVKRPILIDDLDENAPWMEGRHRAIASEQLGLKTIPAFYRVR